MTLVKTLWGEHAHTSMETARWMSCNRSKTCHSYVLPQIKKQLFLHPQEKSHYLNAEKNNLFFNLALKLNIFNPQLVQNIDYSVWFGHEEILWEHLVRCKEMRWRRKNAETRWRDKSNLSWENVRRGFCAEKGNERKKWDADVIVNNEENSKEIAVSSICTVILEGDGEIYTWQRMNCMCAGWTAYTPKKSICIQRKSCFIKGMMWWWITDQHFLFDFFSVLCSLFHLF